MVHNVESKSCLLLFTFVLCFVKCKLIKMKYKKVQYAIINDNKIENNSIRSGRTRCIDDFIKRSLFYEDWKTAYNLGCRCIKIELNINKI